MCQPLGASPYLVGLIWYTLRCFRMCLYAFIHFHTLSYALEGFTFFHMLLMLLCAIISFHMHLYAFLRFTCFLDALKANVSQQQQQDERGSLIYRLYLRKPVKT